MLLVLHFNKPFFNRHSVILFILHGSKHLFHRKMDIRPIGPEVVRRATRLIEGDSVLRLLWVLGHPDLLQFLHLVILLIALHTSFIVGILPTLILIHWIKL